MSSRIRTYFRSLVLVISSLIVLSAVARQSSAQAIEGRVVDADTRSSLPGATVVLFSGPIQLTGQITDADGAYRFSGLNISTYILETSFIGYKTRRDTLSLPLNGEFDILLAPSHTLLEELIVETQRIDDGTFVAGLETIRPGDLNRVPMPDVSYDLAGYLLTLPGMVSTGDRGGQLFVRGGTPTQNLVLIDGMRVFQPFHIVGFYSAFPADIVSFADVYAGGFSARYGGRISSVIDIRTRNGSKSSIRGSASVAPFLTGLQIELPVAKNRASLLLSARESIIDRMAPQVLGQELPFQFGDRFAKFHAYLNQTSSVTFTALRTSDTGNLDIGGSGEIDGGVRRSTWKNEAYGGRYTYIPEEAAVMSELAVYYSSLQSVYRQTAEEVRFAEVSEFVFNMGFTYLMGENQVNFGIFGNTNFFDFTLGSSRSQVSSGVSSGGGFIESRWKLNEYLQIEPGFRIEAFSRGLKRSIGPRARMLLQPRGEGSHHQFSFAWGRYHQQIVGLVNEQDVSDVFTVWSASPRGTPVAKAVHYIAGWKGRPKPWLEFTLEGYRKDLSNLSFPVFSDEVNILAEFSSVNGRAEGIDTKVEITSPKAYFSLAYTRSKVDYVRPEQRSRAIFIAGTGQSLLLPRLEFNPPHDRRDQINAMSQVTMGRNKISLRWQYGSGLPFTQVNGYFRSIEVTESNNTDFLNSSGETLVSRSSPFGGRLPTYHRLDFSFERVFYLSMADLTLQAGAVNVYDRENIFEYNIFTGSRVNQLPIVPSVGVRIDVK